MEGCVTAYLEFLRVTKVYKDFSGRPRASGIEEVSFTVERGETLALLGPNGSGKTTIIKLLAGLLIPDCGEITVDGVDMTKDPRKALKRAGVMLGDARSVYWRLTARDNLEYFGVLRGIRGERLRERITALAGLLNIKGVLDRRVGELSRGMRQRLLLGIALLPGPDLLILDEPTFGLDVAARHEIRELLREVAFLRQSAIIIATHQMDEAQDLADRVCVLRQGKVVTLDTMQSLIRRADEVGDEKASSSTWLEGVFLELTRGGSKGRTEVSVDDSSYFMG